MILQSLDIYGILDLGLDVAWIIKYDLPLTTLSTLSSTLQPKIDTTIADTSITDTQLLQNAYASCGVDPDSKVFDLYSRYALSAEYIMC